MDDNGKMKPYFPAIINGKGYIKIRIFAYIPSYVYAYYAS